MRVNVPVYVEETRRPGSREPHFQARPLFFDGLVRAGPELQRILSKLAVDVRRHLERLGKALRQDDLVRCLFCPNLRTTQVKLKFTLRRKTAEFRALVVAFESLDRTIAFSPSLPELWFEITDGQNLPDRAEEIYVAHFQQLERDSETDIEPARWSLTGKALVTTLDLDIYPTQQAGKKEERPRATLGGFQTQSGAEELFAVGRCLDSLYPDDLDRCVQRERELAELSRLTAAADRRPVLLVGPPQVGKTALVHELVRRRVAARKRQHAGQQNVWLLSPQRLVSGMSFVGQWENRLLAIIAESAKRDHVLYFDDLLGLYLAGVSSSSDLNMAQVMRPHIERREFRLLAEMTPEALRVFRERDRGLADQFHVLPVREPTEPETLRMLLDVVRQQESRWQCRFGLEALPTVLDLTGRYVRDAAFPGKAARFLARLAVKQAHRDIDRSAVMEEFRVKSGLATNLLDGRARLRREEITAALAGEVIGQPAALAAMADIVAVAKARLADPGRPLAAMLFVGPTGVGKTQSAKALAKYLFGAEDRLVRFDMNEFGSPYSATRLVGTFDRPEGLLTAAVRRQPFCVLLLDEIEKADPEVFDLLLGVLGEGRLTDALGRTADFTNAIIVMTSNLGVRQANTPVGFRGSRAAEQDDGEIYRTAAEKFFRPEFFNRIDRVVAFARLRRSDIAGIARRVINGVLARDGLVQRRCLLEIEPAAMERVIDIGFHPELGARALKRAVETHLTAPVAARLASIAPGTPTLISLLARGEKLAVLTQPLEPAPPRGTALTPLTAEVGDPEGLLDVVAAVLDRLDAESAATLPEARVELSELRPEHRRYFAVREQLARVRQLHEAARGDALAAENLELPRKRKPPGPVRTRTRMGHSRVVWNSSRGAEITRGWTAAESHADADLMEFLTEQATGAEPFGRAAADRLRVLLGELALLSAMTQGMAPGTHPDAAAAGDRAVLWARWLGEPFRPATTELKKILGPKLEPKEDYRESLHRLFYESLWGFAVSAAGPGVLLVEGPGAAALTSAEAGTHLFQGSDGRLMPCSVRSLLPAEASDAAALAVVDQQHNARQAWLREFADGRAEAEADPLRPGPILRIYDERKFSTDVPTGLATAGLPGIEELRSFVLSRLPLPAELAEFRSASGSPSA